MTRSAGPVAPVQRDRPRGGSDDNTLRSNELFDVGSETAGGSATNSIFLRRSANNTVADNRIGSPGNGGVRLVNASDNNVSGNSIDPDAPRKGLVGIEVAVVNATTGNTTIVTTDADGDYSTELPAGAYNVSVGDPEFDPERVVGVSVGENATAVVDISLNGTTGTTTCINRAVAGSDGEIDLREIQTAINWWAEDIEVPDTGGKTIGLRKTQSLINAWAEGNPVSCES